MNEKYKNIRPLIKHGKINWYLFRLVWFGLVSLMNNSHIHVSLAYFYLYSLMMCKSGMNIAVILIAAVREMFDFSLLKKTIPNSITVAHNKSVLFSTETSILIIVLQLLSSSCVVFFLAFNTMLKE